MAKPQDEVVRLETLLQDRDGQVQSLSGHMERLTLEKDSLQQELKSLKIKVGEINDKQGMLMETIQAKDEVIMKLSQSSEHGDRGTDAASSTSTKAQQEVDVLKVRLQSTRVFTKGSFLQLSPSPSDIPG